MDKLTPLDRAHGVMETGADAERLRFYERLADAELFLLLAAEAQGDRIDPKVFPVGGENYVLVFDRIERLAEFAGQTTPYAALSGRAIAAMLSGQGVGLGVNLGVAPASILLPATAIDWLAETLTARPQELTGRPTELRPPSSVPQEVLTGLNIKLALTGGLARAAYLAEVRYDDGRNGHLLAFVDAIPGAEEALGQAASEALVFSGIEIGEIDVAFFAASDPICARLGRTALRFDLPEPLQSTPRPSPPGMDPDRPPKLR